MAVVADQVAFSVKSITDLKKDTVNTISGSVTTENGVVSIAGAGSAFLSFDYKYSGDTIRSNNLQLKIKVASNNSADNTRYNDEIAIKLRVQYWLAETDGAGAVTGYVDGNYSNFTIYPYLTGETEGYTDTFVLDIEDQYIKNIYIELDNKSADTVSFSKLELYYGVTVSQAVAETIGFDISLIGVDWYPNGFQVIYSNSDTTDKFYWNGDENDNLNGINVNGEKLIYMRNHTELLQ